MTVDLSRLDVPLATVTADVCFLAAAARTADPVDRLVYLLDAKLLHPAVPLSTDADYPGWAKYIATRQAANHASRKETS